MDTRDKSGSNVLQDLLCPPSCVSGMKELDKSKFCKFIQVPALRIEPKHCSLFLKGLSRILLNQPRMKNIFPDPSEPGKNGKKLLLLHPDKWNSVNLSTAESELISTHNVSETVYDLLLDYDYWTCEQILRAILQADINEVTSSFETVGHIAHMNLRDCQLEYKFIIGEIVLDKNKPQIRTVVNKSSTIDETFRFFKMELLAGENDMNTTVREHGCVYKFDFSKVYWNSRLQTEHSRLVKLFSPSDVICDMFAGVGPFAIPACKKGCVVYANDLNPDSYKSLQNNRKLNHIQNNLNCFNMDGRLFMKHVVSKILDDIKANISECSKMKMFSQVVMNLPAMAVQFLDVFHGLLLPLQGIYTSLTLPSVHCYCFSKANNPVQDAQEQVEKILGFHLGTSCTVCFVRDVAPNKAMLCVSFVLPEAVAFCKKKDDGTLPEDFEPTLKQPRYE